MAPLALHPRRLSLSLFVSLAKNSHAPPLFLSIRRIRGSLLCRGSDSRREKCLRPGFRERSNFSPADRRISLASVRALGSPGSRGSRAARVLPVSPLFAEDRAAVRTLTGRRSLPIPLIGREPAGTLLPQEDSLSVFRSPRRDATSGDSNAARRARVIRAVGGLSVVAPGAIIALAFEFDRPPACPAAPVVHACLPVCVRACVRACCSSVLRSASRKLPRVRARVR